MSNPTRIIDSVPPPQMGVALASQEDNWVLQPAQSEHIIENLPRSHPVVSRIVKEVSTFIHQAEQNKGVMPVGHGAHGSYLQAVEDIDPFTIYTGDGEAGELYVRRQFDDFLDAAREAADPWWDDFLAAAQRDHITHPATGAVLQQSFDFLICVERQHPSDGRKNLLLFRGYPEWMIAKETQRKVRVVVIPFMEDYHIRDAGLRSALRDSPVTMYAFVATIFCMQLDYTEGRRSKDAETDQPFPQRLKQVDICRMTGATRGTVSQVFTALEDKAIRNAVQQRLVSGRTAYAIAQYTKGKPLSFRQQVLKAAVDGKLGHERVQQYVVQNYIKLPSGSSTGQRALPPPAGQTEVPTKRDPIPFIYRCLEEAWRLIQVNQSDLTERLDPKDWQATQKYIPTLMEIFAPLDDELAETEDLDDADEEIEIA